MSAALFLSPSAAARRETFIGAGEMGCGSILGEFLAQHTEDNTSSSSSDLSTSPPQALQQQEDSASMQEEATTPPAAAAKKVAAAIPSSGSLSARGTRRTPAAAIVTPRGAGVAAASPRPPLHAGTVGANRLGAKLGLGKENTRSAAAVNTAAAASPMSNKRKSGALGVASSAATNARLPPSGGVALKKPRMSMGAPSALGRSSSASNLSSTSVTGGVSAPSPRKQWNTTRRSMQLPSSASTSSLQSTQQMAADSVSEAVAAAAASVTAAQAETIRSWQGTAQWRMLLLRAQRTKLEASAAHLAEVESMHASVLEQLATAQAELASSTAAHASISTQLSASLNSESMLRLAAEELGATVDRLTREGREAQASFDAEIAALKEDLSNKTVAFDQSQSAVADLSSSEADLRARLAAAESQCAALKEARFADELQRKAMHSTIQDLKGNIRIFCRIRPDLNNGDAAAAAPSTSTPVYSKSAGTSDFGHGVALSNFTEQLTVLAPAGTKVDGSSAAQVSSTYAFDKVFSPSSTQASVFTELDALLVSALDSSSAVSVMAYGATGAGKTYTMLGSGMGSSDDGGEGAGMIPRAINRLFSYAVAAAERSWTYSFRVSIVEIYCEELRDLCAKSKEAKEPRLTHDKNGRVQMCNVEVAPVSSPSEVHALLDHAAKQRVTASTACNSRSSRSHTVFTLYIDGVNSRSGERVSSRVHLVDLAGSERLDSSKAGSNPQLLRETQAINSSLSALVTCMASIASKSSHVSFRDSKLTHLLADSLAGNRGAGGNGGSAAHARTLFVINISPEAAHYPETICTLRFAEKLKQVELNAAPTSSGSSASNATSSSAASGAETARTRTRRAAAGGK